MKEFAAELAASIAEAYEQVALAKANDDPYGVEVWAERVKVLRRLATRNDIEINLPPDTPGAAEVDNGE